MAAFLCISLTGEQPRMKYKTLPVIVIGALLMGATAWMTYPAGPKRSSDTSKFRYMHCPECEREQSSVQTYSTNRVCIAISGW